MLSTSSISLTLSIFIFPQLIEYFQNTLYNLIIIQKKRVADLDNEKDTSKTINNMMDTPPSPTYSVNDSLEVNNLLSLADSDITPDLIEQLEKRAREEQAKLEQMENKEPAPIPLQQDIQMTEGLPAENGAVNVTGEILERPKPVEAPPNPVQETLDPLEEAKLNAVYKKYVIYINKTNERFIDSLSLKERKELINGVLTEQNTLSEIERAEKRRVETAIKILIAVVTFLITVPLVYLIFNVSMEATIQNYRHSKSNFEILYKETGKIKLSR